MAYYPPQARTHRFAAHPCPSAPSNHGSARRGLLAALLTLALAFAGGGCATVEVAPESSRAAAVVILNRSAAEIESATKAVFLAHGYQPARAEAGDLAFQKAAGFWRSTWSGDWYSGAVFTRARLYRHELAPGRVLLDCDVFLVQEPEDPFFEKVQPLSGRNRAQQRLLEEVARKLRE